MFHSAHGIKVKLVSNLKQSILYNKNLQILRRKGIPTLTGLKKFSLTCKCEFYKQELHAKGRSHGIEFCKS